MWLFRIGQVMATPSLLLKYIAAWRIYILIFFLGVGAGAFSCHKLHKYWDAVEEVKGVKQVYKAEETASDLEKDREKVYKERIKEVIKYVEVYDNVECLNSDALQLFNKRD